MRQQPRIHSPLLATRTPLWRSRFLLVLVGLGFSGLLARAAYVQTLDQAFFQQQGEARYLHKQPLPASRGRLIDRSGQVLASSVAMPSFWAIPAEVDGDAGKRAALARVLGISDAELGAKLDPSHRFVWLRRMADDGMAEQVRALKLKGVFEEREYQRRYPEGEAAAHVVGFTDAEERGQEGLELAFQSALQGHDGLRAVLRDRLGRVVEDQGAHEDAVNGQDIELAIDAKIQYYAYQRLRDAVSTHGAKAGSAVVLDARSGEVLALANYPSYKPDERKRRGGEPLRNRALTDVFEPGSTMKPFIAAQAIESGRVTPETRIVTAPGFVTMAGHRISDAHPADVMTVAEVIQHSSNIGTLKMALQMPPREMHELYSAIGLGQRPQIEFPGAVTGSLRPYQKWRPVEQATMSYGYGLSASLLQLAHAYTVFAHDGELLPLSMRKLPADAQVQGRRVFSPQTARTLRGMLQSVTETGGTAPQARVAGYAVGGKSGTAYKQVGRGYDKNKFRAWFVGLAPIQDPRIVVAVMVDEPSIAGHAGGHVAAPVFSELVAQSLRLMHVPPARPELLACGLGNKDKKTC
jgi:cell division protein FtsI (penicillin-binding protein 3)